MKATPKTQGLGDSQKKRKSPKKRPDLVVDQVPSAAPEPGMMRIEVKSALELPDMDMGGGTDSQA